ncbi:hypothetical protein CXF83_20175 [Shewanella sp. Choline-02u-19]|uniref:hypothetical protein n=1 Tax=unclassified Shewanella TaxID=196818 RepID=UPI000C34CAA1|nr:MULTISPECIES: hypothetical protein [unclassified Shewanella]PKH55508.1 hypothetical protein CXF84_18430 [Shewanella sp. Bg11-22]PKI28854.1 hypothetical protein CXF83_20175 [Shewanella sp. Choline-02u-19]
MKLWQRMGLLLLLILTALACYAVGFASGAKGVLILGVALEIAFWFSLLQKKPQQLPKSTVN